MSENDFEELGLGKDIDASIKIPTVTIKTRAFTAQAIEMYELPSGIVMDMLAQPGPEQLNTMSKMLKLALVKPEAVDGLDLLSFNELTEVMFQWYRLSPIRVSNRALPVVTLEDIVGPPVGDESE